MFSSALFHTNLVCVTVLWKKNLHVLYVSHITNFLSMSLKCICLLLRLAITLRALVQRLRGWWRGSDLQKKTSKPPAASPWRGICTYRRNVRRTESHVSWCHLHRPENLNPKCVQLVTGPLGSVWTRHYCTYEKSSKMFTMSNTEVRQASRQVRTHSSVYTPAQDLLLQRMNLCCRNCTFWCKCLTMFLAVTYVCVCVKLNHARDENLKWSLCCGPNRDNIYQTVNCYIWVWHMCLNVM